MIDSFLFLSGECDQLNLAAHFFYFESKSLSGSQKVSIGERGQKWRKRRWDKGFGSNMSKNRWYASGKASRIKGLGHMKGVKMVKIG